MFTVCQSKRSEANRECQTHRPRASRGQAKEPRYAWRLYVAGLTPRSVRALANIREICEEHLKGLFALQVIDLTSKVPLRSPEGEVSGVLGTYLDITQRKLAEDKVTSQLLELQRWQNVMLDREDRVQELKREVNELSLRPGEAARYPSQHAGPADPEVVEPKPSTGAGSAD